MADKSINQLPSVNTMKPEDLLVLQQDNMAKKMSGNTLSNYLGQNIVNISSTQPTESVNKIWITPSNDEYELAEQSEVDELKTAIAELENMVIVSGTQPTDPNNIIWINSEDTANIQVPTMEDFVAALVSESESGAIAEFSDGANNIPMKSVVATLPYKEGGYTSVLCARYKKNIFPPTLQSSIMIKATIGNDGKIYTAANARLFSIPIKKNTNYFMSITANVSLTVGMSPTPAKAGDTITRIGAYSAGNRENSFNSGDNNYFVINVASEASYAIAVAALAQLEIGSSRSTYELGAEPLVITEDLSELASPVYGGTLNFTTGVLTSTLDSNGDALAEPLEIQLPSHAIASLLGTNVVFADCGNISVEYYADTKLYVDGLVSSLS